MMTARHLGFGWRLSELLEGLVPLVPEQDPIVTGLSIDSRTTTPGDLFFARHGMTPEGLQFIRDAIQAGAPAVIVEGESGAGEHWHDVCLVPVRELPRILGAIADRFYYRPSRGLRVIGVTGTNGKTSVSHFIAQGLDQWDIEAQQSRCGVIGTLGYGLCGELQTAPLTTPDVVQVHGLLSAMRDRGASYAVMEASSHGLHQGRVAGVHFDIAVFTNLTRDHLDYHGDMQAYGEAKRRLFNLSGLRAAVINVDDPFGCQLLDDLDGGVRSLSYGMRMPESGSGISRNQPPQVFGRLLQSRPSGIILLVRTPWGEGELRSPVLGRFNASNLLAALATLLLSGVPFGTAMDRLERLQPLPGRTQTLGGGVGQPLVVIDYAHTPDALETVLRGLREHCAGQLWCVFGCGGNRDRGKRPLMGKVAEHQADRVVLTDDNPRYEDSAQIIEEILTGMAQRRGVAIKPHRETAIQFAVHKANAEDVVLIAGKGHEPTQEIQGTQRPFSDAAAARFALESR